MSCFCLTVANTSTARGPSTSKPSDGEAALRRAYCTVIALLASLAEALRVTMAIAAPATAALGSSSSSSSRSIPCAPHSTASKMAWQRHAQPMSRGLEGCARLSTSQEQGSGQATVMHPEMLSEVLAFHSVKGDGDAAVQGALLRAALAGGVHSLAIRQLFHTLSTLLKIGGLLGPEQQPLADSIRTAVPTAASTVLQEHVKLQPLPQPSGATSGQAAGLPATTSANTSSSAAGLGRRRGSKAPR